MRRCLFPNKRLVPEWHGKPPFWRILTLFGFLVSLAFPPQAQAQAAPEVDLALVLAVDISFSMDMEEQILQREGYVAALTSRPVLDAIRAGLIGRIGVTYLEWAGTATQNVTVDWAIIEDEKTAEAFAKRLRDAPINRARRTSITGAIDFAMRRLEAAPLRPLRRVIDVSGDGPNNEGGLVTSKRDAAVTAGITINGLPIILNRGSGSMFDTPNLDAYYRDCVIGGPGAFMVTITERAQFPQAIRSKILREIADNASGQPDMPFTPAQGGSHCLIGEEQWQRVWERN